MKYISPERKAAGMFRIFNIAEIQQILFYIRWPASPVCYSDNDFFRIKKQITPHTRLK